MKRHSALLSLSRDHYGALKLARDAKQAVASGDTGEIRILARRVTDSFAVELDPHFRIEETGVLVLLARAGEHELVQRTLSEHEEMRGLARALEYPDAAALRRFAELITAHVRFEERELFETAQTLLDATGVERVATMGASDS
jgi:hemerythrin-like domain-containing protein